MDIEGHERRWLEERCTRCKAHMDCLHSSRCLFYRLSKDNGLAGRVSVETRLYSKAQWNEVLGADVRDFAAAFDRLVY